MIIYNKSNNKFAYIQKKLSQPKPSLKRSLQRKHLTEANKNFLKSLNLKLKEN